MALKRKRRLAGTLRAGCRRRGSRAEAVRTGPAPMRTHSTTTSTSDDGFRRVEVITAAGLDHLAGDGEADERVDDVIPGVAAGERLDDGGLGAGHAVREQ